MKCQWMLNNGFLCSANALFNMTMKGEQYGRLCGAHTTEAKKRWPNYEYVSVKKRKPRTELEK